MNEDESATGQSRPAEITFATARFWPASPLAGDLDAVLAHLEKSTPVRLIATLGDVTVAHVGEPVEAAAKRANEHRFDYLPVRDGTDGGIVGLFSRNDAAVGSRSTVGSVMQPLSGANLISADASLLEFVYTADAQPCRLVLDGAE